MPYFENSEGHHVYYKQYGQSGPVIVFVHGLASCGRIWLWQIRALRKTSRVYVLDLPGHGKSDQWEHYSFESLSELLNQWTKYCHINQFSLVALSLGCSIALTFAAQYPQRLNALILEGPVAGYLPWWNFLGWQDWMVFYTLPFILSLSFQMFGRDATGHWLNVFGVDKRRNPEILEAIQISTDFKAIRQLLRQSAYPSYVNYLSCIVVPTLLIRGCNDPMPKRFVNYIQAHLSNASLVEVPQARHIVALEKPQEFNRLIINFLAKCS